MKFFLPGDFLATEEEFSVGENVFEENGNILSDSLGRIAEDKQRKTVSIQKIKKIVPLKVGSAVFGKVSLVKSNSVSIVLSEFGNGNERQVISNSFAMLPVRNVAQGYVKSLREKFKIGDIVKAKVASVSPWGIDLRTNEPELGVVKAFCSNCRHTLHLFGPNLKCTNCGNTEERKISAEYKV